MTFVYTGAMLYWTELWSHLEAGHIVNYNIKLEKREHEFVDDFQ